PYVIAAAISLLFALFHNPVPGRCQSPLVMQGIELYRQEQYGRAAKVLGEARKEDPRSSTAAFFLGLSYKQLMDYPQALPHLRDAVTLSPRIKEALVELIEVLYQIFEGGMAEEAKGWIEVAEKEDIFPAKVAFLKGLILVKEGKSGPAIEAFEKAKALDPTLAQSADVQIALCHLQEKDLKKASDRLKVAVQQDPTTDLAGFARQYQDLVEKRLESERPWRFTLSSFGQYDTNVVLKPTEGTLAPDITNEDSRVLTSSFRVDYVPTFEGPWLFNAQYALGNGLHDRYSTSHDYLSNGLYMAPGYSFGESALNVALRYNHALVRNPSYKKYVDSISAGPLYRVLAAENQILEFFAGYSSIEYFDPPLVQEEDRDSNRLNAYMSWVWMFKKDGFFNLKFELTNDNTDGSNWANRGHDFSLSLTLPLVEKLSLQLSGECFLQRFRHTHTFFDVKREDTTYMGSVGLTYALIKDLNLVLQYSYTRVDSNLAIYDYDRSVYSAGLEYRF
ncbi:MAG: tetratricopeptide repeat protein, partial [Deltaproteobacteria bacterium]|nr:tetratricopeptide repeat protein [Deltaproteobacteria bacterium]